jgi:hypothetical protein
LLALKIYVVVGVQDVAALMASEIGNVANQPLTVRTFDKQSGVRLVSAKGMGAPLLHNRGTQMVIAQNKSRNANRDDRRPTVPTCAQPNGACMRRFANSLLHAIGKQTRFSRGVPTRRGKQ